jgi:hypothetical protein
LLIYRGTTDQADHVQLGGIFKNTIGTNLRSLT